MTTISSSLVPLSALAALRHTDRAEYIQQEVARSDGNLTADQLTAELDQSDLMNMKIAESTAGWNRGESVYICSSKNGVNYYDPVAAATKPPPIHNNYRRSYDGRPQEIDAVDVDFVVSHQDQLYGHDLKRISYYADYLQGEVKAASDQNAVVTFTGWGKDGVTHDVNEYVSWLYEAAGIDPPPPPSDAETSDAAPAPVAGDAPKLASCHLDLAHCIQQLANPSKEQSTTGDGEAATPDKTKRIDAVDVDTVLDYHQANFQGGDRKDIAYYLDYLKAQMSAATDGSGPYLFTDSWGDNQTHNLGEYIDWLDKALQDRLDREKAASKTA